MERRRKRLSPELLTPPVKTLLIAVGVALAVAVILLITGINAKKKQAAVGFVYNEETVKSSVPKMQANDEPDNSLSAKQVNADDIKIYAPLSELEPQLKEMTDEYCGEWSIYIKNLDNGDELIMNDRQMYPASLIKLFVMAATYQEIEDGKLDEDDVDYLIRPMIIQSDNECCDSLLWMLDRGYVTEWCEENGIYDTRQRHGVGVNGFGIRNEDGMNTSDPTDVGRLLEMIYNGECVNEERSKLMLDLLFDQQLTSKIPDGVPDGVPVANKTGETDSMCHDAAIVYSEGATYILVVMVQNDDNAWVCAPWVTEVSAAVYQYYNP